MRIDPQAGEGEFRHVGVPDQHGARAHQALHRIGMARGGGLVLAEPGTRARDVPGDVEQVLDRDGQAVQWGTGLPGGAQDVGCPGGGQGLFRPDRGEGPRTLAARIGDAGQGGLRQGDGRGLALVQGGLQCGEGGQHGGSGTCLEERSQATSGRTSTR